MAEVLLDTGVFVICHLSFVICRLYLLSTTNEDSV